MAADRRDYYEVLGVRRDADAKAIKDAFRALAHRYHPDVSTEPGAEQKFREIAEAYGVLSDPARRARYDAEGFAGLAGATPEDLWGGIDFADILGGMPGLGLFERLFGRPAGPPRGADLRVDLVLSLEEVLAGGKQTVTLSRPGSCPACAGSGAQPGTAPRRCPECAGTGQRITVVRRGSVVVRQVTGCPACRGRGQLIDQPCPACAGTGQASQQEEVTIRIPRGVPEGTVLRLAGRGMPSPAPGGAPGDAYVIIRTGADPHLTRAGDDLAYVLHIPVPDAALGTTAAVPALGGQAHVRVPPGTQPGEVLTVRGQGLPRFRGAPPGQPERDRDRGHPAAAQPAAAAALRAAPRGRRAGCGRAEPARVTGPAPRPAGSDDRPAHHRHARGGPRHREDLRLDAAARP